MLGYDVCADADNQFYICVTEPAQNAVVEILQQMQEDQQKWLQSALEKPCQKWISLGSEHEVDLFSVKQNRPLVCSLVIASGRKVAWFTFLIKFVFVFTDANAS